MWLATRGRQTRQPFYEVTSDCSLTGTGCSQLEETYCMKHLSKIQRWLAASGLVASFAPCDRKSGNRGGGGSSGSRCPCFRCPLCESTAIDSVVGHSWLFRHDVRERLFHLPWLAGHQHGIGSAGAGRPLVRSLQECEQHAQQ